MQEATARRIVAAWQHLLPSAVLPASSGVCRSRSCRASRRSPCRR